MVKLFNISVLYYLFRTYNLFRLTITFLVKGKFMNVRNRADERFVRKQSVISKYADSLLHCSDYDVKAPYMFIGHRMLDIGQIWILSNIEKKWILQDQGPYNFIKGHWEDIRSQLMSDDDLLYNDFSEEEIKDTKKVQENYWIDLFY